MKEQEQKQEVRTVDEFNLVTTRLIVGGLLAICLLIMQALITTTPDAAIYISLCAIAVAIPIHVGCLIVLTLLEKGFVKIKSWLPTDILEWVAIVCTFVGINAALWHVKWVIGVAFIVSAIVAFIVFDIYVYRNGDIIFADFRMW